MFAPLIGITTSLTVDKSPERAYVNIAYIRAVQDAGGIPVLALDMFEHAYHIDFGANAKAYVDAFMRNIDWKAVEGRHEDALKVEPPRRLVQKEFGDLTGLNSLPTAKVAITRGLEFSGRNPSLIVIAENKSDTVAFMVHPRLTRGKGGEDVTPVFWSDNYFSLLPGEKKAVTARFDSAELHGATPELVVECWNVEPTAP